MSSFYNSQKPQKFHTAEITGYMVFHFYHFNLQILYKYQIFYLYFCVWNIF